MEEDSGAGLVEAAIIWVLIQFISSVMLCLAISYHEFLSEIRLCLIWSESVQTCYFTITNPIDFCS